MSYEAVDEAFRLAKQYRPDLHRVLRERGMTTIPTNTPPPSPTDDELLEMMCEAACEVEGRRWSEIKGSIVSIGPVNAMVAALRRIRPLLEARGIEMAAKDIRAVAEDVIKKDAKDRVGHTLLANADALDNFARRHVVGADDA